MIRSKSGHNCAQTVSSGVYYTYPIEGGRGQGGVEEGVLNASDVCTVDVVTLSVTSVDAAKEARKSWILMVPVGGSPIVDPCFDNLHCIMLA